MTRATGLPLPPTALRFMNEDDERLVTLGVRLANTLFDNGLGKRGRILDVGSGYGRLAIGLWESNFSGAYLGFDILPKHVAWCQENITARHERYQFRHHDVRNDRYNPKGSGDPVSTPFPVGTRSHDAAALFSVFTHMYEPEIRYYLGELRRVLRPGGNAVTSWLLFDDDRLPAVVSSRAHYRLVYDLGGRARFSDPADPLRAIGYRQRFVRRMVEASGLKVTKIVRGSWAGDVASSQFQDLVVLRRGRGTGARSVVGLRS